MVIQMYLIVFNGFFWDIPTNSKHPIGSIPVAYVRLEDINAVIVLPDKQQSVVLAGGQFYMANIYAELIVQTMQNTVPQLTEGTILLGEHHRRVYFNNRNIEPIRRSLADVVRDFFALPSNKRRVRFTDGTTITVLSETSPIQPSNPQTIKPMKLPHYTLD
jgi:hypothetical protein